MEFDFKEFPWATVMTVLVTLIVAVVGGIVVIVNPDALSFKDYVQTLTGLGVANGLLGIGRGIRANGKFHATRR